MESSLVLPLGVVFLFCFSVRWIHILSSPCQIGIVFSKSRVVEMWYSTTRLSCGRCVCEYLLLLFLFPTLWSGPIDIFFLENVLVDGFIVHHLIMPFNVGNDGAGMCFLRSSSTICCSQTMQSVLFLFGDLGERMDVVAYCP